MQHRGLVVFWIVTLGGAAFGAVAPGMLALAWLFTAILSIATWTSVGVDKELTHGRWYRGALGTLLACVATETAAAASTLVIDRASGAKQPGFVFIAAGSAGLAIFVWRALVRPSAKGAARVGTFAIYLPLMGLVDILWGTAGDSVQEVRAGVWPTVMVLGFALTSVAGAAACIVALTAFGPRSSLPTARQLD
ncbi:MAG: hypothetical protein SFX73_21655 [Kofleriaceae bacterium]|nr:hypothetical protein [Kofleriaceae bacterium]